MTILGKKQMSEEDIKLNFITPAIQRGWKGHITMETRITDGRINIRGNIVVRSKPKFADYLLYLNDGKPIAVVEAKDNNHSVSHGLQQAMTYAQMMDLPFAYSSNGDAFYEHDFLTGQEQQIALEKFPTQDELIARYYAELNGGKGISALEKKIVTQPYYSSQSTYPPRYYQRNAVNRTVEAIARGQQRFVAITGDTVKNQVVPLPPLAEQKRIVAKIEELLLLVDRYAVAYEKLEQFNAKFPEDMKKSILQYAIQGKLVEQRTEEGTGEELYQQIQVYKKNLIKDGRLKKTRALEPISEAAIPFDFPQPWKVCYIDDIAFVTKLAGFEYTKYIADNLVADGIPLFKGKNVQNGKLVLSFESYIPKSISDELPRSQIAKKCLLTPYVGTIGNIAIFDGSFKAHLGSNVGKIELLNSDIQTFVLEEYVLWYLKSTYGYAELTKHKKATAQESISIDAIRNVIIAIPPLEEQYRIVAKIEELLPLCDRLRK
ncbi:restriction endonuclease subunit S [Evtepia gabavorous]|uniref:restriction endonuclease subunit S n=1 Tax=Evtepia gabavorous TaxID=2211183 RepID=UPI003A8E17F3